jgi:hypothetical protein
VKQQVTNKAKNEKDEPFTIGSKRAASLYEAMPQHFYVQARNFPLAIAL